MSSNNNLIEISILFFNTLILDLANIILKFMNSHFYSELN